MCKWADYLLNIVWIPYGQSIRSVMFSSDIATHVKQSCQRKNHLFPRQESLYQESSKLGQRSLNGQNVRHCLPEMLVLTFRP
ncbi:unnamed protein product [Oikopleura dioica]|uniref:Uncharacterized protein n=1 Tax=Oikopleura dioica TaxID=34765 RepID=E4XA73_OIKDI|nr:unnamed protein product [Oikopleura dioica]